MVRNLGNIITFLLSNLKSDLPLCQFSEPPEVSEAPPKTAAQETSKFTVML